MIIPKTIEAFYGRIVDSLNLLKSNIDQTLGNIADSLHITYVPARIKPKDSLMAKIEKEGCKDPANEIKDLVACRFIVKSTSDINAIIERLEEIFNVEKRDPRTYRPDQFIYDDIQLILSFKDNPLISNKEIVGKKFELQIRTGLQDALAEGIRSETYKSETVTWQKERMASELRANVELVDTILSDFPTVSSVQEEKDYELFEQRNKIITILKNTWSSEKLPDDLRRASIIIENYLRLAGANIEDLSYWIKDKHPDIVNAVSITPCQIILIILLLEKESFLDNVIEQKRCLLITDEMIDICPELNKIDSSYCVSI